MSETQGPVSVRRRRHGTVPVGSGCIVILAILFSLLFIVSTSLAFVNPKTGPQFGLILDQIASKTSGIILLGENVDVDVDEPQATVRWSILGCGPGFSLPNSPKLHGSSHCSIPATPMDIFVDNFDMPAFSYRPDNVPTNVRTGQRLVLQAQMQFDSDHVLDVHNQYLYPFDTYLVTSTLRITIPGLNSSVAQSIPIIAMPVIKFSSSFTFASADTDVQAVSNGTVINERLLEIRIERPGDSRTYAVFLFGINWVLSHFNFAIVVLSVMQGRKRASLLRNSPVRPHKSKDALKQLAGALAVLLVIPQLRDAMPDAPGFDGVLIDSIGFFPQMTLAGLSAIVLMLILAKRELDNSEAQEAALLRGTEEQTSGDKEQEETKRSSDKIRSNSMHYMMHGRRMSTREVVVDRLIGAIESGSQAFRNASFGGNMSSNTRWKRQLGRKVI